MNDSTGKIMDYFGGRTRDELEALLRRIVVQGPEGPKVDFKRVLGLGDKAAQTELAKDIASIANTDDEPRFDDLGFVILGAERGSLVGGVTELAGDLDKLQARLTDVIKGFVSPVPAFSIVSFQDASVGTWGALVIPPSAQQPHVFIRDGAADVVKHEWWVRVNDTKERAGAHDYGRFQAKAVSRIVRPLERELARIALLVEQRRDAPDLSALVAALSVRGGSSGQSDAVVNVADDLVLTIRRVLVKSESSIEEKLTAEALRVYEVMSEGTERNPWVLGASKPPELLSLLEHLEDQSMPLVEAIATIARHDREGALTDGVVRALRVIAREPSPPPGTSFSTLAPHLRLYPLVLCLYAAVIVGGAERRSDLLREVLGVSLETDLRERTDKIVTAFRRIHAASEVFQVAMGKKYVEPVATRVREILVPRLAPFLAGRQSTSAFFVGEFIISLAFMASSAGYYGSSQPVPLSGAFMYEPEATRAIRSFLATRPDWLAEVLGEKLETLLGSFDANAKAARQSPVYFVGGFSEGALDAYKAASK